LFNPSGIRAGLSLLDPVEEVSFLCIELLSLTGFFKSSRPPSGALILLFSDFFCDEVRYEKSRVLFLKTRPKI